MQIMKNTRISLILHDIRSSENVGAMFRTADAAGVSAIYLTGYTPAPLDRFGRPNTSLVKASLGAEKTISWSSPKSLPALIKKLKKQHIKIIAIEQHVTAQD